MLDTNIFNQFLEEHFELSCFPESNNYFVTHIQFDELNATKNKNRRQNLLNTVQEIPQEEVPTKSGVWGTSKWNKFKWGSENNLYQPIKDKLDKLNKGKKNNIADALIAETAIKNQYTLVTNDNDLTKVVKERGGHTISMNDFITENAPL